MRIESVGSFAAFPLEGFLDGSPFGISTQLQEHFESETIVVLLMPRRETYQTSDRLHSETRHDRNSHESVDDENDLGGWLSHDEVAETDGQAENHD